MDPSTHRLFRTQIEQSTHLKTLLCRSEANRSRNNVQINLAASVENLRSIEKKRIECIVRFLVDGYFGDAQDCRLYHVCVDGRDYRSMCAPGLAWESLLRLCMSANLVNCPNSKSFDASSGEDSIGSISILSLDFV